MSFYDIKKKFADFNINQALSKITEDKIKSLIDKKNLDEIDFLCLISDKAYPFIELMAKKAHELTIRHFGRIIFIFTPLYISNYCDNSCPYCSFAKHRPITRKKINTDELRVEAEKIKNAGIRHILILTGESRRLSPPSYITECIKILKKYFSSIAIEIYPMTESEYMETVECGVDSLTIYQEVYNEKIYERLHLNGPKSDYRFRLDAPERALRQNMRSVNIGMLLGLNDPVEESFFAALHIKYLQDNYPEAEFSISLPRIRPSIADYSIPFPVDDKKFVQLLAAFRIWNPSLGITISTRESREFRNSILPIGVTKMSAGVSTSVGGHTGLSTTVQFEISDSRSVEQMQSDIIKLGFQPVMHDWNYKMYDVTNA